MALFDALYIDKIYDQISGLGIDLAKDPTTQGPSYLHTVIAQCRDYLNRTTNLLIELSREKRRVKNELSGLETAYSIREDHLLANEPTVLRGPSIEDRKARVRTILHEDAQKIRALKGDLRNLEDIEKAVRIRHDELVRTDGMIKTQRNLIHDELRTGGFYGNENPYPPGTSDPKADDLDAAEIDRLLAEPVVQTSPAPPEVGSSVAPANPEPVVVQPQPGPSVQDDLNRFYDGVPAFEATKKPLRAKKATEPKPEVKPEDDFDFSSILDQIV